MYDDGRHGSRGKSIQKDRQVIYFTFIYKEVEDLYCHNNGRPSIDPVVLFKH